MPTVQYIFIFIAIVIMLAGLVLIIRSIRKRSASHDQQVVSYDKNGIPIIPRHERTLVEQPDIDDALAGETVITPDRRYLEPVVEGAQSVEEDIYKTHSYEDLAKYDQKHEAYDTSVATESKAQQPETYQYPYPDEISSEPNHVHEPVGVESLDQQRETGINTNAAYGNSSPNDVISPAADDNEEDLFSSLASATENLIPPIETALEPEFMDNSPMLDQHLLSAADEYQNSPLNHAEKNINITLIPYDPNQMIPGTTVLQLVEQYGFRYGAMNMFHRYENKEGTGILWFSMMGITEEGIIPFDLNTLPTTNFYGLVLFLSLPHPKALQGFDSMMSIVGLIANQLDTHVLDENNEVLTREMKQELRTQVQEYQLAHRQ